MIERSYFNDLCTDSFEFLGTITMIITEPPTATLGFGVGLVAELW